MSYLRILKGKTGVILKGSTHLKSISQSIRLSTTCLLKHTKFSQAMILLSQPSSFCFLNIKPFVR